MNKVLIISGSEDAHAYNMSKVLHSKGIPYLFFLTDKYPYESEISFEGNSYTLYQRDNEVKLSSEWSIWNRRVFPPNFPEGFPKNLEEMVSEECKVTIQGLMVTHEGLVVNNPFNNYIANNKIEQLKKASRMGLLVPDTLVTNNPQKVKEFYERHNGDIIFKMQKLSIIKDGGEYKTIMTTRVKSKDIENIGEVRNSSCCFQERIDKNYEVRLTIIGERLFPIAIYSQNSAYSKDDFRRYDFKNVDYKLVDIPQEVGLKLLNLTKQYGLHYAAIDLIFTPKGEYVFLEINPNGQYLWTEEMSGAPITEAFADYLAGNF